MEITICPPVHPTLAKLSCSGDVEGMVKFYKQKKENYFTNLELLILLSWLPSTYFDELVDRVTKDFIPFLGYLKNAEVISRITKKLGYATVVSEKCVGPVWEGIAIGLPA